MGPSGAGKTTFMNALCGRAYYGTAAALGWGRCDVSDMPWHANYLRHCNWLVHWCNRCRCWMCLNVIYFSCNSLTSVWLPLTHCAWRLSCSPLHKVQSFAWMILDDCLIWSGWLSWDFLSLPARVAARTTSGEIRINGQVSDSPNVQLADAAGARSRTW